jgi:hypothetical protein
VYSNISKSHPLEWASTILAVISIFVTVPIFYFYRNGKTIREKSKFAAEIEEERKKGRGGRPSTVGEKPTLPGHEEEPYL